MRCAATSASARCRFASTFAAAPTRSTATAAKEKFTLCALSRWFVDTAGGIRRFEELVCDRRGSGHRRLGAFREKPDRARAELHPNLELFQRGWRQVDRADRAGDARAEHHCAGHSRAYAQGRIAPAW